MKKTVKVARDTNKIMKKRACIQSGLRAIELINNESNEGQERYRVPQ